MTNRVMIEECPHCHFKAYAPGGHTPDMAGHYEQCEGLKPLLSLLERQRVLLESMQNICGQIEKTLRGK